MHVICWKKLAHLDAVPEGSIGDCGVEGASRLAVAKGSAACILSKHPVQDFDAGRPGTADALDRELVDCAILHTYREIRSRSTSMNLG